MFVGIFGHSNLLIIATGRELKKFNITSFEIKIYFIAIVQNMDNIYIRWYYLLKCHDFHHAVYFSKKKSISFILNQFN